MLVLSRKENESIVINDNIEIKIISLRPDQVKLGIVAPRDVKVFRREIYDEIQQANIDSVKPADLTALKNVLNLKNKDPKEGTDDK